MCLGRGRGKFLNGRRVCLGERTFLPTTPAVKKRKEERRRRRRKIAVGRGEGGLITQERRGGFGESGKEKKIAQLWKVPA